KDSVRAQVTVDMNFDERTRTEETYGKNSAPNAASVRSQQNIDSSGQPGGAKGATPGALTNQPPPQPTAPLTGPLASCKTLPEDEWWLGIFDAVHFRL
ncbi:MAG: flagellar M-ring protein FliF, partial [Pseudomonadota bacterium]